MQLTARWVNAQQRTKRLKISNKKLDHISNTMEEHVRSKARAGKMPPLTFNFRARYEELGPIGARPAFDWV